MANFVQFRVGLGHKVVPKAMAETVDSIAQQTAAGRRTHRSEIDAYTLTTMEACGVVSIDGDFVVSSATRVGDFDFSPPGRWR